MKTARWRITWPILAALGWLAPSMANESGKAVEIAGTKVETYVIKVVSARPDQEVWFQLAYLVRRDEPQLQDAPQVDAPSTEMVTLTASTPWEGLVDARLLNVLLHTDNQDGVKLSLLKPVEAGKGKELKEILSGGGRAVIVHMGLCSESPYGVTAY